MILYDCEARVKAALYGILFSYILNTKQFKET